MSYNMRIIGPRSNSSQGGSDISSGSPNVNLQGFSAHNGVPVSGQRWILRKVPNEQFFAIENYRAKKVLDFQTHNMNVTLQGLATQNGVPVSGQRWFLRKVPNEEFYIIENYRAKKVLDFQT